MQKTSPLRFAVHLLPSSLANRVFALYGITLLMFVGGGLFVFLNYQFQRHVQETEQASVMLIEVVAQAVQDSAVIGDFDTVQKLLNKSVQGSQFEAAQFIVTGGGMITAKNHLRGSATVSTWITRWVEQSLPDINRVISVGGIDYGILRLKFDIEAVAAALWSLSLLAIGGGVSCLIAGLILIRAALTRWLGGLVKLRESVELLGTPATNSAPLVLANAPAEIQSLVEMVNRTSSLVREREATRVALHNSEERWQLAMRGANDGIWDWSPQTTAAHFSDRWKAMLGYAPHEIGNTATEWLSRIHHDDLDAALTALRRHQEGETEFYQIEYRLRCKDGSYKWILDRGQALFDVQGNAVRMAGSHSDITERHQAEKSLHDRTEQLNSIFALSPDGIVSFDVERRIISVNPAFVRMVALEEAELIGLTEVTFVAHLAKICTPEAGLPDISVLRTLREGSVLNGRTSRWSEGRYRIELAAPRTRVLEVSLRDGQTGTVSQILYFSDITHKTEVDRLKSEFLSTAAHELRTPMASVLGYSELMLAQEFDDAERRDFLETILRNARLMSDIINELLDLARIEARRGKDFKIERLPAAGLLREVIADFKVPAGRATPLLALPTADIWLRGDRGKLTQAIGNILSNAYKYSPAGGAVTVDLIAPTQPQESPGDGALPATIGIRIADHGIGMTPLQLARVCERFYRADTSGKISGTGLGMSIVKEIVELHGGNLELDSTSGAGTAVTLRLQVLTQAVSEQPGGTLPAPASTQEMSS